MRRAPASTYRLQLHSGFTFDDAAHTAEYLKSLGISHVYCSPYLQATPGSTHGYDVADYDKVNEELGGEEGHQRFCQRLKQLNLGQILDIVPNHMAIGRQNRYWWDVLENGPSSPYSSWFDIEWNPSEPKLQNKVLIPVLGDQYGRILSAGEIKMVRLGVFFEIHYGNHIFPIAPRSLAPLLARAAELAKNDTLNFIADSFDRLPLSSSTDLDISQGRHRDKRVIYELLKRLCNEQPQVCNSIDSAIDEINANHDALDDLLNMQQYRLAYWRTAGEELGYRRFFDVNSLIGLRMERAYVFEATHRRVIEWLANGTLDGVRIDHPDGLRDPKQYFQRLRARAPEAWIVGEKILAQSELLRPDWPIEGTTGYDFINVCNDLFVHGDGLKELTAIYGEFTAEPTDFSEVAHDKKLNVEQEGLGSDVNRLTSLFVQICENNRDHRDHTRAEIRRAIREVAACFPIYRTYVLPAQDRMSDEDRAHIEPAIACAKQRRQDIDAGLFDFLGSILTLNTRGELESEFLLRFQQSTSPVMAKGVEDTAFYCFSRMIALNEVGGAPGSNGIAIPAFHDYCATMQATHPFTMTTLSTHDTKRADDVRARLAVLTEIPDRWRSATNRWSRANARYRTGQYPDRNTEYFLYQTLLGAWPICKCRLTAYMEKATREAKQRTSWTQPNPEFEQALNTFIERILDDPAFIAQVEKFLGRILLPGRINSLAQSLLRYTAPGVPDTYQGSELWDLSLVDPDNRRPVDYSLRQSLLNELQQGLDAEEIMRRIDTGLPKLWVAHRALTLRRDHPDWFNAESSYTPLTASGPKADHLIAYLRSDSVAVLVPRWPLKLAANWAGTTVELPPATWTNILTQESWPGGTLRAQALFQRFPVALLIRTTES
jgi:(1->4)-alpha-D-glucan 1-alpha-D-glucosylmutase